MWNSLVIGLLLPLVGTMAGSAFVFIMKDEMSSLADSSLLNLRLAVTPSIGTSVTGQETETQLSRYPSILH
jgi:hypothetical protein